jgi:hypothetical protein
MGFFKANATWPAVVPWCRGAVILPLSQWGGI